MKNNFTTETENLGGKQHINLESLRELDGVLPDALLLAIEKGVISITPIRRKFEIGYPRAAKIIDIMEEKGFISSPKENGERTVYVKKEDLNNLEKFSRAKTCKQEEVFTKDQKTTLEQHKKDFNLDNLQILDENGKTLNLNKSKHLKDLLLEQFCGIGIICMEFQDAEVFFKKNNYVMHCKTFDNPKKEELQTFIDKNKIDAAMILYEVNPRTLIADIQPLIPKMQLIYFSVTNPIPTLEQMKVHIIY